MDPMDTGADQGAPGETLLEVPLIGKITARSVAAVATRYHRNGKQRQQEEDYRIILSGHKKGSNPRIKLDHGRLWSVYIPPPFKLHQDSEGNPAIFAVPADGKAVCQLQKYSRQPQDPSTVIFSLTNGADKCYIKNALVCLQFRFLFGFIPSDSTSVDEIQWVISEESYNLEKQGSSKAASPNTTSKVLEWSQQVPFKDVTLGFPEIKQETKHEMKADGFFGLESMELPKHHEAMMDFNSLGGMMGLGHHVSVDDLTPSYFPGLYEQPPLDDNVFSWAVEGEPMSLFPQSQMGGPFFQ